MDHEATREELELAAAEAGGLERLMAGDTATAQAVAAHLAGCPSCSEELARLQRSAVVIRTGLREMPSPDLKARTLQAIRTEGVRRPLAPAAAATSTVGVDVAPLAGTDDAPRSGPAGRRWRTTPVLGWIAAVAAAVVLSVVATSLIVNDRVQSQLAAQADEIATLERVTTATLTVTAQPDAQHVALLGVDDPSLEGGLTFSPSTAELVVVATGLTPPPAGLEYRCWLEVGGTRNRVGKMFFYENVAFWVGPAPAISGVSSGGTFGVSLVDAAGPAVDAAPVLLGEF